ncbi:MAG: hypothetical protein JXQ27_11040 [Acidobacteria bacterium]|nr:hypothetical protein [Acidobacteriota bacterium]
MRRISYLLLFLALVVMLVSPVLAPSPKPPRTEQKMVRVPGNLAWTDTGLTISRKDRVTIGASGTVFFSNGASDSGVGPLGWSRSNYQDAWPDDWLACDDPLPSGGHAGLLARIGSEEMFVGASKTFDRKEGRLFLGINDCTLNGNFHNTGQFEVTVKVARNVIR